MFWLIGGVIGLGLFAGAFDIQLIPDFQLGGIRLNWVTAAAVAFLIFAIIKYGTKNKTIVWASIIGIVLLFASTAFSSFLYVQHDMSRRNEVVGNIRVVDPWSDFNIHDFRIDSPVFYHEFGEIYRFRMSTPVAYRFDGDINQYNLLFNNQPANITVSIAGTLFAEYRLNFYDNVGNLVAQIPFEITFLFLNNSTRVDITIIARANVTTIGFLNQYLSASNGIHLRLIEGQYNPTTWGDL